MNCFTLLEKVFFFQKDAFIHHVVFDYFFHLITICVCFPCFFIYHYFHHITFFTRGSFSIFVKKGCEKKEKYQEGNIVSIDTLADTATIRSSHRGCSVRKGVLRNLQNSQENTCAGLIPATLFKKRLWLRCFLVKFAKFLRTPFLQNISGRLLLNC